MASSVHFYLSWAKERMDEMDAVVASLEGKAGELTAQSRAAADKLIADLREQRDAFLVDMQKRGDEGEAARLDAKAKMESDWNDFQSNVKKFVDDFGQQFKQPQTTFQEMAVVQLRSWREAAERVQVASAELTADRRAKMEATVAQMKADAFTAEEKFKKLRGRNRVLDRLERRTVRLARCLRSGQSVGVGRFQTRQLKRMSI
jgi:hypothetical protein